MTGHSIPKSILMFTLLASVFLCSPLVHAADTNTPLPPEARQAFDKGMVAAEQKEWQTAIRYFLKAQEVEPYAPEILFNLGLAESKVPGRELRAIVWFRAFLAKAPNAPNADAVRKEIASLEIRAEAIVDKLIAQAKQLVAQEDVSYRNAHYGDLAIALARAGDISGAKQTAAKDAAKWGLSKIAAIQYHAGDAAGAWNTIAEIGPGSGDTKPYYVQSVAYGYVTLLQAIKGDFPAAEATIGQARCYVPMFDPYVSVAMEEALAGRRDQALSLVAKTMSMNLREMNNFYEVETIQAYLGDIEAAKKTHAISNKRTLEVFGGKRPSDLPETPFRPSVDRRSFQYAVEGRRDQLRFIGDEKLLTVRPSQAGPSEKHVEWVRFLKDKLNDELFTNQQSAISTIAGKARPQEIVSGMLTAIESITNRLNEIRTLGK